MSEQESIRPDQLLTLSVQKNIKPKTVVSTALLVRSLYAAGMSAEAKQQIQEDDTGLIMKKIDKLEHNEDIEVGTRMIFIAPSDANPQLLNNIREKYKKKNA